MNHNLYRQLLILVAWTRVSALIMWSIENVQIISPRVQIDLQQNTNPNKDNKSYQHVLLYPVNNEYKTTWFSV